MEIGIRDLQSGKYYPFTKLKVLIGSGDRCDILLDLPDIEEQHAEIRVTNMGLEIDDLGSAIGTYVNKFRIEEHFLSNHDRLVMGEASFEIEFRQGKTATKKCDRCGVEIDARATRRISRAALFAGTNQSLCERCEGRSSGRINIEERLGEMRPRD